MRQEAHQGGVLTPRRAAEHLDLAGGWPDDVQHHAQGGGLAGAIAAEKPEDAALGHGKAQVVDRGEVAEPLHDVIQAQNAHALSPSGRFAAAARWKIDGLST